MYIILKQFIIGLDVAWVAKLNEDDELYQYETESEAIDKLNELISTRPDLLMSLAIFDIDILIY